MSAPDDKRDPDLTVSDRCAEQVIQATPKQTDRYRVSIIDDGDRVVIDDLIEEGGWIESDTFSALHNCR